MLYLIRKLEESIILNNNIEIKIVDIKRNSVKLGVKFPKSSVILRKELYDRMEKENLEALRFDNDLEEYHE